MFRRFECLMTELCVVVLFTENYGSGITTYNYFEHSGSFQ